MTLLLLGVLTGAVMGLTGAGGGVLAVPLLMAGAQLTLVEAAPIGLSAVALAGLFGAALAWRSGHVRYRAAGWLAGFGIVASPGGVWLAHRVPTAPLTLAFACVMAWVAWTQWQRPNTVSRDAPMRRRPCLLDEGSGRLSWTLPCARMLAGTGALAGALSGLLGVGGGFVVVPGLQRTTNLSMEAVIGTSLAVVALVSAWGVATSVAMGHLDPLRTALFASGAVSGTWLARRVAHRFSAQHLRRGFALAAAVAGIGMAWAAWRAATPAM